MRLWTKLSLRLMTIVFASTACPISHSQNISHGMDVFSAECSECHSTKEDKNKKGPSLFLLQNRKAGSLPDVVYSEALRRSGIVWTSQTLAEYLRAPKRTVPGGKMKYDGLDDDDDLRDLLGYLFSLK